MKCRVFLKDQCANLRPRHIKDKGYLKVKKTQDSEYCEWIYREGKNPLDHFAFTPCKPGFNYLGESEDVERIFERYSERRITCPICNKPIRLNRISDEISFIEHKEDLE